jgi:hypothetical protein
MIRRIVIDSVGETFCQPVHNAVGTYPKIQNSACRAA